MSVGYNYGSYYGVNPKKDVKKDGFRAGCVGALTLGAGALGTQALVMNSPKLQNKIFEILSKFSPQNIPTNEDEVFEILIRKNPTGSFMRYCHKIDWLKAGKIALIGGTIIGLAAALKSAMKKLPDDAEYMLQDGYYA